MPLSTFHPLTRAWFGSRFDAPTPAQADGWPQIAAGRDVLVAAPTGSGKTLAAFLAAIDGLLRQALAGTLEQRLQVLYVSPLRALAGDIQRNLEQPLAELLAMAREERPEIAEIRALVRTGDTPQGVRQRMLRRPPQILVTTPESLYLLLTARRGRELLRDTRTVIVDEIHALARDKRGSHLALSLERLAALCERSPQRIGLSATVAPLDRVARFLCGAGRPEPAVVDRGHLREIELAVETPELPLQAVCTHEHWEQIYQRLIELVESHRSTLIFVNTRRLAERIAHQLAARLSPERVACHHGSLAADRRRDAEQRLKQGQLTALVATASLELGIDVGHIDLVCQIGSPRAIHVLLQRIGRAGHALHARPAGRLFALTRDDLIECLALVRAVRAGRLDRIELPRAPLDILAQQLTAEVAAQDWSEQALYALVRRAEPFEDLAHETYLRIVELLSEGIETGRGRRGAYLHRDRVGGMLRARRHARIAALTCGGAIPEITDYRVVTDEQPPIVVGTVDEDFAVESQGGDVFSLGTSSWRILRLRGNDMQVADARGAPPTIPFWRGEAPGRTAELSEEVSRLREELAAGRTPCGVDARGAEVAREYVAAQVAATGFVPTGRRILFERFFDVAGGMQLVVHSPLGIRINRAWGLALRKRFCRSFNFELQASADDDGIVLSLGPQHSFPLEDMFRLVPLPVARDVLIQALLAVPFFAARWRWNVTRALIVRRFEQGRRVPPPLQRMRSDDLLAAVFPAATECLEHKVGDTELPDHPLVEQTVADCLCEATDAAGWLALLRRIEQGQVELVALDSREPSPFAHERLSANPYAFLDDAPLEERRARAVSLRRTLDVEALRDLGRLDPAAIAQVRDEARPLVRDAEELHDALLQAGALPPQAEWRTLFETLARAGRAARVERDGGPPLLVAAERWPLVVALWPDAHCRPALAVPPGVPATMEPEAAAAALVRGRLETSGPQSAGEIATALGLVPARVMAALLSLEQSGAVLRGRFSGGDREEWCCRQLLARIHRLTLEGLRRRIEPVPPEQFLCFLQRRHWLLPGDRPHGPGGLREVVARLQGFEAAAGDWERRLLPARMQRYDPAWLDLLALSGEIGWGRLVPSQRDAGGGRPISSFTRAVPIALLQREDLPWLLPAPATEDPSLSGTARAALELLRRHGALFERQLLSALRLPPAQLDEATGELAAAGLVTSDGFQPLRGLLVRGRRRPARSAGRWCLLHDPLIEPAGDEQRVDGWCRLLLERYGVVFRDLLARERAAPAWAALARRYRVLEARGEIRGGRFVSGVGGEQYALEGAVRALRDAQTLPAVVVLPATDPTNLFGRLVAGPRIPAASGTRLALQGGRLLAWRTASGVRWPAPPADPAQRAAVEAALR